MTANNCWLYADYQIPGLQLGVVQLSFNASADLAVPEETTNSTIANDYEVLSYLGQDQVPGVEGSYFQSVKKLYNASYNLTFDFRYWNSYQGDVKGTSGVYIFTPDWFEYDSLRYS